MTDFYGLSPVRWAEDLRQMGIEALKLWGVEEAHMSLIKMRENAVFRVDLPSGESFALRIHRHGYHSDDALRSELQWLKALDDAGIDVPRIRPSTRGRLFEVVQSEPVPESRQVTVFEWIEGQQLGESGEGLGDGKESVQKIFRGLGELCARLHNQSSSWHPPKDFSRHAWDAAGLTGEDPLWGRFWELDILGDTERRLIHRARAKVREELLDFSKAPENYSIIHADLIPENVLVQGDRLRLIDFDDAGWGWHLFELATVLYFHSQESYYDTAFGALIQGYRSQRPLSDETLSRLPLFMLARSFTYLGWAHTRRETETARNTGPKLVDLTCQLAEDFLYGIAGPSIV